MTESCRILPPCFGVGNGHIAQARPSGWPCGGGARYLDSKLATISAVTAAISAAQRPSVLHVYSLRPLVVDGTNSIIDAWITAAGGRNAAQISGNIRPVSTEQVAQWNPDVIILASSAFAASDTGQRTLEN
ncbi:MAG: hypothetical protein ACRDRO_11005 [Pseudonocardiaceae bacterium]